MLERIHYIHLAKSNISIGYENHTLRLKKEGEGLYNLINFLGFICPSLDTRKVTVEEAMKMQEQLYCQLLETIEQNLEEKLTQFKEDVMKHYRAKI